MKAIITKYYGPTNPMGARIKATAEGVPALWLPYPYELSGEACHRKAAEALRVGVSPGMPSPECMERAFS